MVEKSKETLREEFKENLLKKMRFNPEELPKGLQAMAEAINYFSKHPDLALEEIDREFSSTQEQEMTDNLEQLMFEMATVLVFRSEEQSFWPEKIKQWFRECEKSEEKRKMFYSMVFQDWFSGRLRKEVLQEMKLFEEASKKEVKPYWKEKYYKKFISPALKEYS